MNSTFLVTLVFCLINLIAASTRFGSRNAPSRPNTHRQPQTRSNSLPGAFNYIPRQPSTRYTGSLDRYREHEDQIVHYAHVAELPEVIGHPLPQSYKFKIRLTGSDGRGDLFLTGTAYAVEGMDDANNDEVILHGDAKILEGTPETGDYTSLISLTDNTEAENTNTRSRFKWLRWRR